LTTDSEVATTPSTGWKPDFTKPSPYEGMPQEYVELEAAAYKPTPEQPLPPSQRTPEGLAAIEAAPEVSREIAAIKLAPESTPDKPVFSPEDYGKFQELQEGQQFVKSVELGLVPKGSEYTWIKPGEWGYYTPEQVAEVQKAKVEAEEVYKARVADVGLAREAVTAAFERDNTQLPDEQWIDNKQLARLETEAPNIHKALTESGFAAADKIIKEQQEALSTLRGYAVLQAPAGTGICLLYTSPSPRD